MTAGYVQTNLREMIEQIGEDRVRAMLSDFSSGGLNPDVEDFLRNKAIIFSKQGWAATHLVFASYREKLVLTGYYTLALKYIMISRKRIPSKTLEKRIAKFAEDNTVLKKYIMSVPLIAQLGKNYSNHYDELITGDELLKLACDKVKEVQLNLGGRFVYLECEDKQKLLDFYGSNGFVNFGKRYMDKEEEEKMEGKYLIQMMKYIK